MDVAITGSSGFLGRALTRSLKSDGHRVVPVVRGGAEHDDPRAVHWDPEAGTIDAGGLVGIDAVVHLAGEGIASRRWTDEQRHRIRDSRARGTALLAEALAGLSERPKVLVSGSAVGYYGDRGDEELTERSAPGTGFLPEVCQAWEAATGAAEEAGIRVAHIRTGIVLSTTGGALAAQLLPFKLGLGGRAGSGRQWLSWISLADEIRAIRFLLDHDIAGPVNLTAPGPVTSYAFAKTLGAALHRPAVVPIPRFLTRLPAGIGDLLETLLFTGARVQPTVLVSAGFEFRHETLEDALREILAEG